MAPLTNTITQKYYNIVLFCQNILCKCAKCQDNPANISKGIPTFNIREFNFISLFLKVNFIIKFLNKCDLRRQLKQIRKLVITS